MVFYMEVIQVLFVLVRKNKLTKKQSAALFLFWQRCGTVTECVQGVVLTYRNIPNKGAGVIARSCLIVLNYS